jgi:hypothetical protein
MFTLKQGINNPQFFDCCNCFPEDVSTQPVIIRDHNSKDVYSLDVVFTKIGDRCSFFIEIGSPTDLPNSKVDLLLDMDYYFNFVHYNDIARVCS